MPSPIADRPGAVLVGVQLPDVSDLEHATHLAELGRLVRTLGYQTVATLSQRRGGTGAGTVLGAGKLQELARLTGGPGVIASGAADRTSKAKERWEAEAAEEERAGDSTDEDPAAADPLAAAGEKPTVVVVDHELTPSQLRNLEKATGALVLDRTGVIVDIFHRHARSREARMQVEIARLKYLAPRLRESSGRSERQQGRGAGDSAVELDRRKIRDRVAELNEGLAAVQRAQDHRRFARRDQLRVALVGYTNAGKSSLMRALTGSEVLVADQLFATLDTTVRSLQPESRPRVLVSDTVGFLRKLPHDLVASFRSTLDEALEASLLLYVADASDPSWEDQLEVSRAVLREIGAAEVPNLLLLNKIDRLDGATRRGLQARFPEALLLSAHASEDVAALRQRLLDFFEAQMVEADLRIPYARQGLIAEVYESARVLSETFDEAGRNVRVRSLPGVVAKLARKFQA
ncbi:GTPase HflX [Anaeromyxobacter oryzae]|uniref:GTPase HflX n=1 Tax=Anaeromyxobacter oryzae TaxID=2918170 RepID=A0ABM7WZQ7_9BACT|nr:GTPase HflX [Anaeromyxobacter oryzae]BDG05030.1 GTPase HflX [Anaeromyxobacter oryzae]